MAPWRIAWRFALVGGGAGALASATRYSFAGVLARPRRASPFRFHLDRDIDLLEHAIARRLTTTRSRSMDSTQPRHGDVIIARRFGERSLTHTVTQLYAVTYPGHTDQGTERESYDDAERMALKFAKERRLSVWYEENPHSGRRILVESFRDASADHPRTAGAPGS